MKVTKTEKRWLFAVVLFYVLYNLPTVPGYGDPHGLLIHAALTIIPLWVCIYIGLVKVFRIYRIRTETKKEV
ncbi:MAG: hypothetical protein ACI3XZ_04470 [Butyricicoccus sp.]